MRETGEPIPQPLEDPGEEQGARAWVQVLLDKIQGLLGRGGLRQILQLRPGEEILRWADREARPWERLQALQCAMGELERGRPGRTHHGGARGSDEPMDPLEQHVPSPPVDGPDMPPSGDPPPSPTSSHRRAAFQVIARTLREARGEQCRAETEEGQPEAEPEGEEEGNQEEDDIPTVPFGTTPPELFETEGTPPGSDGAGGIPEGGPQHTNTGGNGHGGFWKTSTWTWT